MSVVSNESLEVWDGKSSMVDDNKSKSTLLSKAESKTSSLMSPVPPKISEIRLYFTFLKSNGFSKLPFRSMSPSILEIKKKNLPPFLHRTITEV